MVSNSSYQLHGPQLYHVTSTEDWRAHEAPADYTIQVEDADLSESLEPSEWPNAISPVAPAQGRPITVTALATHHDAVAGVATATADSDTLWQIGIDVRPEHRGRGLGPLLTSEVARVVLHEGRVPYYGTVADNVASRRTAQSAGFWPCWTSVYTTGPVA